MAYGGGSARHQWPPYSSSSSTLSPLAPPFTVDRKPSALPHPYDYDYDYAAPPSDPSRRGWRTLSSDLVQAEPFYPQHGSSNRFEGRIGGECGPWNGPFDEGGGRERTASSSSYTSWTARGENGEAGGAPWIQARASAAPQQGGLSDAFSVDNIWCSNHVDPYARKYVESDCQGWLQDKPSVQTEGSFSNPVNSSGSILSPPDLTNSSFPYVSSQVSSKGVCDILNSASPCYFGSTMQNGSSRGEEVGFCLETFNKSTFMGKDPKVERSCIGQIDIFEKYAQSRHHVSVNIREPRKSSNVELVDKSAKSNNKRENILKSDAIPVYLEKENPPSSSGLCKEEPQPKLPAKSDLTIECFGAGSSVEPGNSNQNSEIVDQANLAEDSPCWRGALASQQSPFHGVNTFSNSPTVDKKFNDANFKVLESSTNDSKSDPLPDSLETKKEVSHSDDLRSGFHTKGCNDALLSKREIFSSTSHCLSENEIVSSDPVSNPTIMKASSYSSSHVYFPTWESSLRGAFHFGRPIGPPKFSDLKDTPTKFTDGHFLFRTLYDLSSFCLSYCGNENVLNGSDYELLLMTRYNVEACLSERRSMGDKKECQYGPSQVEVPQIEANNLLSEGNSGGASEIPKSMQSVHSNLCYDNHGGLPLPTGSLNFNENVVKDFEKSMVEKFDYKEEDPETNLYKKLWIEAEAALCKMKYELHLAQAKMGQQRAQLKAIQDVQDSFSAEGKSNKKTVAPFMTRVPDSDKENDLKSVTKESQTRNDLNLENDASSPKPEEVVLLGVLNTTEDLDSSVMARFRVLTARANKVDSSNIDAGVGVKQSTSEPSCSCSEFDSGMHFQPSSRLVSGSNPRGVNAGMPKVWRADAVTGSHESHLMPVIESYIPNNGWGMNKFQDGKQGSTSSDWEHVLQEDAAW